jgi:high affinity Mn2+ porin
MAAILTQNRGHRSTNRILVGPGVAGDACYSARLMAAKHAGRCTRRPSSGGRVRATAGATAVALAGALALTGVAWAADANTGAGVSEAGPPGPTDGTPSSAATSIGFPTSPQPWQAGLQATYLWQHHPSFAASYDGPHSLLHQAENGYTLSATLFVGVRPWRHTEIYVDPEVIQSEEMSELHGLGAFNNAENQKTGSPEATLYLARAFVRQTIPLGGEWSTVPAAPNQLAGAVPSRRLVVTLGRVSLVDLFDGNAYAHDGRTQFMNWVFMTHAASDYAADARGYTWGAAVECYVDDWAVRFGRFAQPKQSNGLALDFALWRHYGDNLELEHAHVLGGRPGKVHLMVVRNAARMADFDEAIAYAAAQGSVPDLAPVRREQAKYAVGLALEQTVASDVGAFARLSWNDGRTETYAFTEVDRSATAGAVMRGRRWRRADDSFGLAVAVDGISPSRRRYLAAGGLGPFLGDGQLRHYARERLLEAYYAAAAARGLWASAGYQLIGDPGYNADRGPVSIFSLRLHAEY